MQAKIYTIAFLSIEMIAAMVRAHIAIGLSIISCLA
jgi:hypothetical protein